MKTEIRKVITLNVNCQNYDLVVGTGAGQVSESDTLAPDQPGNRTEAAGCAGADRNQDALQSWGMRRLYSDY